MNDEMGGEGKGDQDFQKENGESVKNTKNQKFPDV